MPYPKKTLADLTSFVASGITPRGGNSTYVESGPQLVRSQNVLMGSLSLDNVARISPDIFESMRRVRVLFDDVLLNITGASIGRVCRVGIDLGEAVVNQHVAIIRTRKEILSPTFLAYALRTDKLQQTILSGQTGAAQGGFNHQKIRALEIPLPPLPEQHRIVEILDQADALRQQRRQADQVSSKILPALFHEMFGDPLSRSSKWSRKTLDQMGSLDRGISKNRPRNAKELLGGPYPLIQTGDIANSNGVIKSFSSTYSESGLAQSRLWPARTLCITIAANIGKTAILNFAACFPDSVVGFVPFSETNVEYVQYLFHFFQPMLEMNAPQAAQKNINLKVLRDLEAPAPPFEMQAQFGYQVQLFRESAENQTTSAATLETLFQTLLHRAFDGSLTAKWREAHAKELLQEMKRTSRRS